MLQTLSFSATGELFIHNFSMAMRYCNPRGKHNERVLFFFMSKSWTGQGESAWKKSLKLLVALIKSKPPHAQKQSHFSRLSGQKSDGDDKAPLLLIV